MLRRVEAGEVSIPDDDCVNEMQRMAVDFLKKHGFARYEISNYAREGCISRHNTGYWLGREYIGLGPAAHSLWQGGRYSFPRDLQGFVEAENPFALWQQDGEGDTREEFIMLRLRLAEGFDLEELETRWPEATEENQYLKSQLPALEKAGLVKVEGNRLRLTRQGFLLSNGIIARLI